MLANYSKVYEVEVNLTVGYNLIVIPQGERFVADIGDIVGFQRNTSGAVLQRTTVRQTPGVYYSRAQHLSKLSVHLQSLVALNFSFRVTIHGSVKAHSKLAVSCLQKAGIYALTALFSNPLLEQNKSLAPVFQSIITVQNPIEGMKVKDTSFIAVNRSEKIKGNVLQGTNITCVWEKTYSSLTERFSLYLEENRTTEGATCEKEFSFPNAGYVSVMLRAVNLVSKKRTIFHLYVREIIQGLKVEMCHSSFAYDKAVTCYNSSITSGTDVGCTWYFSPTDHIKRQIGRSIIHRLTPVGVTNFTLYCYNKLPEIRNATFRVQVVANPLSIIAPLTVAVGAPIKITCRINWPSGSPTNFFDKQGLAGKRGTDIKPSPLLTVRSNTVTNTTNGSVILHERFLTKGQHKIDCTADRYPDLNTFHMINAIHPITDVTITTTCPSRIQVGASCRLQVNSFQGDSPSVKWTVSEGHSQISVHSGSDIDHRFVNIGVSNVSVNISNDVSWSLKFIEVIVYSGSGSLNYPTRGLQIRDMALSSSNLLTVEFDIIQGNNVTYLVDFGDLSGKPIVLPK